MRNSIPAAHRQSIRAVPSATLVRAARRTCCEMLERRLLLSAALTPLEMLNPGLLNFALPSQSISSAPKVAASKPITPRVGAVRRVIARARPNPTAVAIAAGHGLQAQYFNSPDLSGAAALTRIDPTVSFLWGLKAPAAGLTPGNFSVQWTGSFTAPRTGRYTFFSAAIGGDELLIDGTPLIDRSTASGRFINRARATINLTAGQTYAIELNYYATGKRSAMLLHWAGPRVPVQALPLMDTQSGVPQPTPPATLTASAISASEIDLSWPDIPGEAGFQIQRSTNGSDFATIATVAAGITTYDDTTLANNTAYDYRIITSNLLGDSAPSQGSSATTLPPGPTAPASLSANVISSSDIVLTWTDTAGDQTGFTLQRSTNGGPFSTLAVRDATTFTYTDTTAADGNIYNYRVFATANAIPSNTPASTAVTLGINQPVALSDNLTLNGVSLVWLNTSAVATAYVVQRSTNGSAFAPLSTLAPSVSTYLDSSAVGGNTYKYQVLATTAYVQSSPSNAVTVAPLAGVPAAPTSLVATPVSDTEINLTWSRTGTGETSLSLYRSTSGGPFQLLSTQPAGSNIWTDTSCYPNTPYTYQITANNPNGSSPPSTPASATTQASAATLPAPTGFTAAAVSPFEIDLSWTDNISGSDNWLIERSTDGVSFSIVEVIGGSGGGSTTTYADTPVSPGTTYYYRTRAVTGTGYSDYTPIASATTATLSAGTPLVPTNITPTVNSATSTTVAWTDTNGGSVPYDVQTSPFYWTPAQASWTDLGTTANGATSFTITTTAETAYYVRIRAVGSGGDSAFTAPAIFRTASAGTGSPQVYTIGPGEEYASLGALNWSNLGPGDTVEIFPNKDANGNVIPYYEKPLISVRGTAAAPITIEGMPDSLTGQMPIIDGTNAVTAPQWTSHYAPLDDNSLVLVGTRADNNGGGWSPGYFGIKNLQIRNGYGGDPGTTLTYTAPDGSTRDYAFFTAGIYIEKGDHIGITGCTINGNNLGIFGAGQGDSRNLEELTIAHDQLYGNGTIGQVGEHNTYIEGLNTLYEFDAYGPLRTGADGAGLKDRGAGTVIRYSSFQGGGHMLDLVDTSNYASTELTLPSYEKTYVYGNTFYDPVSTFSVSPIHYGGDMGLSPFYRKGTLYFYNNTFVAQADQSQAWAMTLFDLDTGAGSVDSRNNIICVQPSIPGDAPTELDLLSAPGTAYFGTNWVSQGWQVNWGANPFTGAIAGSANFITSVTDDPGFTDAAAAEFSIASTSQVAGLGGELAANEPPVLFEAESPAGGVPRLIAGSAISLGSFEG